ncbi:MAG TPA: hypothetical protein VG167_04055 [Verrucomicrobiae bacterium]|nr:hypothetical protein [Verrucomicrobiae bacterium]
MNDSDFERFEQELLRITPAQPPPEYLGQLLRLPETAARKPVAAPWASLGDAVRASLVWRLRWLIPAAALAVAIGLVWTRPAPRLSRIRGTVAAVPFLPLKADSLRVHEHLVSSFDAIGRLSTGEPVRFRCREWMDEVVVSDKDRGFVLEQRTPRVEVIPVRFETY